MFEKQAKIYSGLGGAEFDDLVQEQAEAAWIQMELGFKPHTDLCRWTCIAWIRYVSHRGLVYNEYPRITWFVHENDTKEAYEKWLAEKNL